MLGNHKPHERRNRVSTRFPRVHDGDLEVIADLGGAARGNYDAFQAGCDKLAVAVDRAALS
jgi:hypothetical protein